MLGYWELRWNKKQNGEQNRVGREEDKRKMGGGKKGGLGCGGAVSSAWIVVAVFFKTLGISYLSLNLFNRHLLEVQNLYILFFVSI